MPRRPNPSCVRNGTPSGGALLAGNTDGGLTYFVTQSQERYRGIFTGLQSSLSQILSSIETFALFSVSNKEAQAETLRTESGTTYSYPIIFFCGESQSRSC